mmetsp:Transcript_52183/g.124369  ORF Transcript_52183/g.124369 Transcript_52183/m.124369 type:complete len:138 (-) Transcript_52183:1746-2159(-)
MKSQSGIWSTQCHQTSELAGMSSQRSNWAELRRLLISTQVCCGLAQRHFTPLWRFSLLPLTIDALEHYFSKLPSAGQGTPLSAAITRHGAQLNQPVWALREPASAADQMQVAPSPARVLPKSPMLSFARFETRLPQL